MNAQRTDAMAAVTHLRPMRESDLDEIMRIEVRAYPFPWTRGIFRDCLHAGYPMWVQEHDGEIVLAVERSDFPVIKAATVYLALATMLFNLAGDALYRVVDPRVRLR